MKAERERERRLVSREFETQRGWLSGLFFSFCCGGGKNLVVFFFPFSQKCKTLNSAVHTKKRGEMF